MHPDNWQEYQQGSAATLAPDGGIVDDGHGNAAVAYGVILSVFQPQSAHSETPTLEEATDGLVASLRRSNSGMSAASEHQSIQLGAQSAISTRLENDSPAGGRETDWLVTTLRPDGLFYVICVAPKNDFSAYEPAFHRLLDSVRFPSN